MIDVIQVYKLHSHIGKPNYTTEIRERLMQWPENIFSKTGYIENEALILPTDKKEGISTKNVDLIILQDIIDLDPETIDHAPLPEMFKSYCRDVVHHNNSQLFVFNRPSDLRSFELFKLVKEDDSYSLFLKYSNSNSFLGEPKRQDHKIAKLKKNLPVRYRINGKNDFSLTGRRQRSYLEYDYILDYLGAVKDLQFKENFKFNMKKHIPVEASKLIDERKILY